jgi:hypothetical protein
MKKILMFILVISTFQLFAQRTITGTVTDEKGETIVGAAVRILGTTKGTVTDIDGKYAIQVSDKDIFLSFSFVGMTSLNAEIGVSSMITAVLKTTTLPILEVIGYSQHTGCHYPGYGSVRTIPCYSVQIINGTPPRARYTSQTEQLILTLNVLGNPFKDRFILSIKSEEAANAVISLHSIDGKLVKSFETQLLKSDNQIEMTDLAHLVTGAYTISVTLIEQNNAPKIMDKLTTVNLPYRFYNKIMSAHPELTRNPFKEVIPLSKEQYALVIQADKLRENVSKLKATILNINREFDAWDLDDDAVSDDDALLYKTYKGQLMELSTEYQSLMTNPLFKEQKSEKEYSLNDFIATPYMNVSNLLLIKREVVSKKKIYSQVLIKM